MHGKVGVHLESKQTALCMGVPAPKEVPHDVSKV